MWDAAPADSTRSPLQSMMDGVSEGIVGDVAARTGAPVPLVQEVNRAMTDFELEYDVPGKEDTRDDAHAIQVYLYRARLKRAGPGAAVGPLSDETLAMERAVIRGLRTGEPAAPPPGGETERRRSETKAAILRLLRGAGPQPR